MTHDTTPPAHYSALPVRAFPGDQIDYAKPKKCLWRRSQAGADQWRHRPQAVVLQVSFPLEKERGDDE
jgi:hypothetical protein